MKSLRWVTLALALAMPSTLLADDDRTTKKETTKVDKESTTIDKDKPRAAGLDEDKRLRVKNHIVPAVAGVEAADKALGAIFELAGTETLDHTDTRSAILLAQHGIKMALDEAESLHKMSGLSDDAQSEAFRAVTLLRDARTTLLNIDKQVGKKAVRISRNKVEQIRDQAKDMHSDLSDAEDAIERVARAYDVPTDLEFGG